MRKSSAPRQLGASGRALWDKLMSEYLIEDAAGLTLLQGLCESFERIEAARAQIAKDGLCIVDRFGMPRAHPACQIEHAAKMQLIRSIRALRLAPDAVDA